MASKTKIIFKAHDKQEEYMQAVFSGKYNTLLFGGAIRGGKSYVGIFTLILLCKLFPNSKWAIVRKDLQVLKKNTIPVFWKVCPRKFLKSKNETDHIYTFKNGSQILFIGENFDKDKELNRFRGLEVNGFLLEEVNELHEETYYKCIERAGANFIDPMPAPLVLMTCNPSQNWVKEKFYLPWSQNCLSEGLYYLPSKITDNPYIPQSYMESLLKLPEAYRRIYIDGSWDAEDAVHQLISWELIHRAKDIKENDKEYYYLGVDVAGHGKDKTVFILMKGNNIVNIIDYDETSIPDVYEKTKELIKEYNIDSDHVVIDGVGLGSGVIDLLARDGYDICNFIGGGAVLEDDTSYHYRNLKAQGYWHLRLAMENDKIGGLQDSRVQSDIASIWYDINGEKCIEIQNKKDTKLRIGRSPDFADALMYVNWARIHDELEPIPGVFFV